MVEKFLQCHAQIVPGTRFSKNIRKHLQIVKRRAIAIWVFGVLNGGIYLLLPFMMPGRHFTTDLYVIYGKLNLIFIIFCQVDRGGRSKFNNIFIFILNNFWRCSNYIEMFTIRGFDKTET